MGHSNHFILVLVFVYKLLLRYDQGREDGAVIDDWEDPNFEIYHTQDRYPPTPSFGNSDTWKIYDYCFFPIIVAFYNML